MQSLYDFLRRYKREDGSELCEPFIRAPKRRTDPEYYEVVSDPLDLLRIQQKLKTEEYADTDELRADFQKVIVLASSSIVCVLVAGLCLCDTSLPAMCTNVLKHLGLLKKKKLPTKFYIVI